MAIALKKLGQRVVTRLAAIFCKRSDRTRTLMATTTTAY
jgi:hypothetical protein